MKTMILNLFPNQIVNMLRSLRRMHESGRNRNRSVEEVFTDIYKNNKWGGGKGEYCSGAGSTDENLVAAYISMLKELAGEEDFRSLSFVDLGCGDFRVGRQLLPLCSSYIGGDIVRPLIDRNQAEFGNEKTKFIHLNIVEDDLPDGDVCFIRQVFQHLSNQQIQDVLKKIDKYKMVFITEHYPVDNNEILPNIDKSHGGDIRIHENSGVYLDKPPFNLSPQSIRQVLEFKWVARPPGVIRTYLYRPHT